LNDRQGADCVHTLASEPDVLRKTDADALGGGGGGGSGVGGGGGDAGGVGGAGCVAGGGAGGEIGGAAGGRGGAVQSAVVTRRDVRRETLPAASKAATARMYRSSQVSFVTVAFRSRVVRTCSPSTNTR
jgi:hypothetical protein